VIARLARIGWRGVFFALFDFVVAMGLVDEHAADSTGAGSYNGASRAANLSAYNGSGYCAARDKLGLGVMMMVMRLRLRNGVCVRLLRGNGKRQREDGCGYSDCCKCHKLHIISSCNRICDCT